MNKYAIYTDRLTYPVLEKDGQYYIGVPGTGHFSGQWKFLGVRERLKNSRTIIKPEDALKITDWQFKNGSPRYQVVDLDHGSVRTWAGTSADQQLRSFDTISDSGFNIATKTDKDEEIVLEESKKYAIYATYGGDGVYNSKLVDTVDSEEQAVDRVAELQATGVGASYEEIDNEEENDKISNIADKIYDKYSEFVQGVYEDNKNLNEFVSNMCEDEGFLDYLNDYYDITSEKDIDLICRELYNIQVDIMNSLNEEFKTNNNLEDMLEKVFNGDNWYIDETDDKTSYLVVYCNPNYQSLCSEVDDWVEDPMFDKNKKYTIEDIEAIKKDTINEIKKHIKYYKGKFKVEEECSQASGVASGANGKIDSFPINPKEMENQRLKESIDNSLIQKDFERMNKMKDIDSIKDYLYEITMNQNYDEARNTLISYLKQAILDKNENIINATKYIIDTSFRGLQGLEDFFTLTEAKEDDIFNAREELIDYLNENTKYEWNANEMYDNCAITESETDYIEVFVDIKDGNKIYTVDNYSYNSLEELVKNMPVLFTDEDEDYDYDEGWEDEEEYQADKELDQKKTDKFNNEGPASFDSLKKLGIFDKKESKDITETLHEMALLEDYQEENISSQKQKFIEFCKDKIEDLGDIEIYDEDYEEDIQYHKLMHTEGIREFNDLYIIANFDDYENENLIAINNENKIVINTPMIDCNGYAATMQFDKIDKQFYDQLMDFWDDIYMDEMIEEE